jgi:hypothetical protein
MYHMVNGEYRFDHTKNNDAHAWCLAEIKQLMTESADCVVSNTFTRRWEYQPYMDAAREAGFDVQVIDCHGPWHNVHNVPPHTLEQMRKRWQPHGC